MRSRRVFPRLPALDALSEHLPDAAAQRLRGAVIVLAQHLLETTGSLVEQLLAWGALPDRVHLVGKRYSTDPTVARRLAALGCHVHGGEPWPASAGGFARGYRRDISRLWAHAGAAARVRPTSALLVVDDGAHCLQALPCELPRELAVLAVEQTTRGLRLLQATPPPVPVVSVASSAAKRLIESPVIGRSIRHAIERLVADGRRRRCTVIGMGNVGGAVAAALREAGHEVVEHDAAGTADAHALTRALAGAELVLGCTGTDITRDRIAAFLEHDGPRTLVSCSSEDVEFSALLGSAGIRWERDVTPHGVVLRGRAPHERLTVLREGFPVNFQNGPELEPRADIQLTRGLLLAAILQCLTTPAGSRAGLHGLDPALQRVVVRAWSRGSSSASRALVAAFDDPTWVAVASVPSPPPLCGGLALEVAS